MSLLRRWTATWGRVFSLKMKSEESSLAFGEEAAEEEGGVLDNEFQKNLIIVVFLVGHAVEHLVREGYLISDQPWRKIKGEEKKSSIEQM